MSSVTVMLGNDGVNANVKRSPKCYNLLRKIVALLAKRTLIAMLEKVPFKVGINQHIFRHISECLTTEQDKCRAILFDEMDIKEYLQYDATTDRIIGFADSGETNYSKELGSRALVFMRQGLSRNWEQPVMGFPQFN